MSTDVVASDDVFAVAENSGDDGADDNNCDCDDCAGREED